MRPGTSAATSRLNRCFAIDDARVYALTDHGLVLCEDADRNSLEVVNRSSVRDVNGRLYVAGSVAQLVLAS